MKCQMCEFKAKNFKSLGIHLKWKHPEVSVKDYYDNFLKRPKDGLCYCGNLTKFKNLNLGYFDFCSRKCASSSKETTSKKIKTVKKEYGVDNISQLQFVKDKKVKTCLNNYGQTNPMKSEFVLEKVKETVRNKFGVDNVSGNSYIKRKKRETCLRNYGVEFPAQHNELVKKANRTLRMSNEKSGLWVPLELKSDFERYKREVWIETKKWKDKLFKEWNGKDFYTGEKLVVNEEYRKMFPKKHLSSNPNQPTIDHRTSIFYGFYNNIEPNIIGHFDNLCVCSRTQNSKKQRRCL